MTAGAPRRPLACPPRGWGCVRRPRAHLEPVARVRRPLSALSNVEAGQSVALVGISPVIGDTLARIVQARGWTDCLFIVHIWQKCHLDGRARVPSICDPIADRRAIGAHNCHSAVARGCRPTRTGRIGPDPGRYRASGDLGRPIGHPGARRGQDGAIRRSHHSDAGPIRGAAPPASWARADAREADRWRLSSSNMPSALAVCSRCAAFRASLYR